MLRCQGEEMNLALYQLADDYLAAFDQLTELDMPPEVVNDTLESMRGDIQVKATNVAMFVRNLESMAESIREAEKQMASRRKAIESRAKQIEDYLLYNMQRTEISRIESPYFAIIRKMNPPKVVLHGAVPDEFLRHPSPPPPEADKKAIAEYIKAGNSPDWAELVQTERVEIK